MTTLAMDIKQFAGINTHRQGPAISHLFFADDSLFFFKTSRQACTNLKWMIDRFCLISGQVVNLQKSLIKFSPNTPLEKQQEYKGILRMDSQSSLGTYLGTPIDIQGSKVRHFTPLLDKVSGNISQWRHRTLSQSVKLIIINSILIPSILHHLVVFSIPCYIVNKLDGLLCRFFWTNSENGGLHWKKRALLHLPKGMGGLGLRSTSTFNKVLLMRNA